MLFLVALPWAAQAIIPAMLQRAVEIKPGNPTADVKDAELVKWSKIENHFWMQIYGQLLLKCWFCLLCFQAVLETDSV